MSRFRKLSHTIWHCQYHIVWVPKYRHRILTGSVGDEVGNCIRAFSEQKEIEIIEMNVQPDHVHLLTLVPPKVSISGNSSLPPQEARLSIPFQGLNQFRPLWGRIF